MQKIELFDVEKLRHIEAFSERRVRWLHDKIVREGIWNKPLALDDAHGMVLDGQHRMEVALRLGLSKVPAVRYEYAMVEVWSLRPKYRFEWSDVVERVLNGDIYPYKTVKHRFPGELPSCSVPLGDLT